MMDTADPRARYAAAARCWNELMSTTHGVDDDGGRVYSLTPAGGAATALGAPVDLRTHLPTRLASNPLVLADIERAAVFLETWGAWIRQEGGREEGSATSMFEHACRPSRRDGARGWSAFGGAALALDRQGSIPLDGDSLPPVRVLQSIADALRAILPAPEPKAPEVHP